MLRRNPTGHMPEVSENAFIDPTAIICGKVIIEDNVFIGPYAVIRLMKSMNKAIWKPS